MEAFPSQQRFVLAGLLEAGYESYSIFDAKLVSQFPVPSVALTPTSCILGHKEVTWDSLMSVMDLCSGFGGFSQGILPCGFHTSVAVDHNEHMLRLFSAVSNVPTILGDVGDKATIYSVWKEARGSRTMTGGFSCQPFSSLGDGRSSADPRASCLPKLLHAAFYLRVHILVLECVAPAAQDLFVRSELDYFCSVTGFSCTQRTMKLDQVWPCKRNRSWWVLTSPLVGKIQIPEFTCLHAVPTIGHIIPRILPWDLNDEDALKLNAVERTAFGGQHGDFSKYLMNQHGVAPCALHAWGNQLTACPCGCRQQGLSSHRLSEKGLFGLLVHCAMLEPEEPPIRHVHPCEAQALNGMDPTLDFGLEPRLTLSAVGQLASPLQVVWIMAAILDRLADMRFGKVDFTAETQLHAYMSWLVMKCALVWAPFPDDARVLKFDSLMKCWKSVEHLSLEELMYPNRWVNRIEGPVTIAAILDALFRDHQLVPNPVVIASDDDQDMPEAETPWMEFPQPSLFAGPDLDAAFCTVIFDGDMRAPVKLNPLAGSTLQELLSAHDKLVGTHSVHLCVDAAGQSLPLSHCLSVGELIFVQLSHSTLQGNNRVSDGNKPTEVPQTCLDADVTPTAAWSQPIVETGRKPSIFDIGECSIARMVDQPEWLSAEPLLGLKGEQFLVLSTPNITTPQHSWSVRNQFLKVKDRLEILDHQGTITSDDELRFHLFALSQKFIEAQVHFSNDPVKQLVTIDPLIASAWLTDQAFSCEEWAQDHGFIHAQSLPIATVFKLGSHWVPVSMHPVRDTLNVFVWDADDHDHLQLNAIIERVGLALGFISVCIQRDRRMFFMSDLCGTLAVAYLHSTFLQRLLPASHEETMQRFLVYREEFLKSLATCDITRRPWIWATGDTADPGEQLPTLTDTVQVPNSLSRDQRIDLLVFHQNAVADDESRFHIQHILDRHHAIMSQRNQTPAVLYLFFEPLVFTCWESIGRTISARWAERNPEVRTQGKQILTAFLLENHWFPFWIVPNGDCLTFHTVANEDVDAHKFRDVCACMGQQLGFPLFALHINPNRLPRHDMCGTFAMMFLAHVVHGAILPDTLHELSTLQTNMRAVFVEDLYTKHHVPSPVIWGNGCKWESGPLPKLPCLHELGFSEGLLCPTYQEQSTDASDSFQLVMQSFEWETVQQLLWTNAFLSSMPSDQPPCSEISESAECMRTLAMDVTEMDFHLSRVQQKALTRSDQVSFTPIQVLHDRKDLVAALNQFAAGDHELMLHVALFCHHWVPIIGLKQVFGLRIFVPDDFTDELSFVTKVLPACIIQGVQEHPSHNLCGARAINVAAGMLGLMPILMLEDLECLHHQLKCDFLIGGFDSLTGQVGFGPHGTLLKDLADELVQHGVPHHLADSRANDAIRVIGSEQLLTAMKHRQPWRQLKTLGNQKKFKFVLPSEMAQMLDTKPTTSGGKGNGKHGGKNQSSVELDPAKLQIVDGIFRSQGRIIPQLHVKQIGPLSSGVIMMTLAEAEPYLRSAQCVSSEPLALAVLHRPDVAVTTALPHKLVTVPCRCTVDKEPVLADATLVQIGQGLVEKHQGHDLVELETLDVVTVKYLVYRDEIPCPWDEFCKAPIKFLVNAVPLLRRCMEQNCQCDMWHNPDNLGVKEPILDVWRRQYLRAGFKPAPMDKADIFSVCLRVPAQILEGLLAASGSAGAYGEPRSADGTEILSEYTVVWSPKMSTQELMHLRQTNPAIIGIARVGDRKGVRVRSAQASVIHQLLKPDTVYLPQGQRSLFLVGPFPFGIDRSAICRAMKQSGWECRPLQPSTPMPGKGSMWIVQAVEAPSNTIIPTSHGEVVITRHKPEPVGKPSLNTPIASAATLALCGTSSSKPGDHDPWTTKDPWGGFKPSTAVAHTDNTESLQQLERRVQDAVLAKLPAPAMEDDMPERMSFLEGQVQQLMVKQQGLEGQFHDFSAQQGQQLTAMQTQINNQGQQLHGHMENQSQAIQSMFAQQMDQIRGLLSKRPRDEFE